MTAEIEFQAIEPRELDTHITKQDAIVIDVRSGNHHEQIYGAIRYDPKKLAAAPRLVLPLPKGDSGLIVLYDERGTSHQLRDVARKLTANGYGEIRVLAGGFDAWSAADGRVQERSMEQPIPEITEHQIVR